ncbi:hypothetical protein BDC45DRAFT_576730 [Circinella umbellata]|nr:hypothetical protein BDC45DRAFT_576730 [Circinella umbellata]
MTPEIVQWAGDDYKQKASASLKGRLNEALSVYNRVILSVKKELREESGVALGCAGCRFMYYRFAKNKDPEGAIYPGDDAENSHYWSISPDEALDDCGTFGALRKRGGQSKKD